MSRAGLHVFLIAALAFQAGSFIVLHSNTVDEMAYVGSGASYLHSGRLDIDIFEHPPLMKYLIGLALLPVSGSFPYFSEAAQLGSYQFGYRFIYRNPQAPPERIMVLARLPSLMLSMLLALFVFLWASRWYGPQGGALALAAYCFEPNLIAHSGLATFDLGLSCFLLIGTYFLIRWIADGKLEQSVAAGLAAGGAVATKIPGLIYFLWSPCLLLLSPLPWRKHSKTLWAIPLTAALLILALYQLRFLPAFAELFRYRLEQTFYPAPADMDPVFLHGAIRPGGWRSYFLTAFAVKTTIPFLVLFLWAALASHDRRQLWTLLLPPALYLFVASFASKQGGLRYVLPIIPFLCVLIGGLAKQSRAPQRILAVALIAWSALECAFVYPHYLGYFNELAGGSRNGHAWFWDSNVDWGQDMPLIGRYLRDHGSPEVIVASAFNASRDYYLGQRQDLVAAPGYAEDYTHINSSRPARELFVISAVLLDGLMMNDPNTFAWLKSRPPLDRIGYSTLVYDVSRDAASHFYFGLIYRNNRRYDYALREFRRAADIEPKNPLAAEAVRQTLAMMGKSGARP